MSSSPPAAMDTSNICWVVQHKFATLLQFCYLPVARKFLVRQHAFFTRNGLYVGKVFSRAKHGSTGVCTRLVKTVEYGVLKIHVHCMKISYVREYCCFVHSASTRNWTTIVLWKKTVADKYPNIWLISSLCRKRVNGIAASTSWGDHP
jgi:hypothetical protein